MDDAFTVVNNDGLLGVETTSLAGYKFAEIWDDVKKEFEKNTIKQTSTITVIYNTMYECAVAIEHSKRITQICEEFPDFKIVRTFTDIDTRTRSAIEEHINNNMYCDLATVEKKVEAIENLFDIAKKNPQDAENALILCYIKTNYHISEDVSKRVKVSVLLDEVQKELKLNNTNLKHKFASILAEIGLQKKRFSDGMYLFGIESKAFQHVIEHNVHQKDMDAFIMARNKEIDVHINTSKK
jgi:hypothetical protein